MPELSREEHAILDEANKTVVPFGPHKGLLLQGVNTDYLNYMLYHYSDYRTIRTQIYSVLNWRQAEAAEEALNAANRVISDKAKADTEGRLDRANNTLMTEGFYTGTMLRLLDTEYLEATLANSSKIHHQIRTVLNWRKAIADEEATHRKARTATEIESEELYRANRTLMPVGFHRDLMLEDMTLGILSTEYLEGMLSDSSKYHNIRPQIRTVLKSRRAKPTTVEDTTIEPSPPRLTELEARLCMMLEVFLARIGYYEWFGTGKISILDTNKVHGIGVFPFEDLAMMYRQVKDKHGVPSPDPDPHRSPSVVRTYNSIMELCVDPLSKESKDASPKST